MKKIDPQTLLKRLRELTAAAGSNNYERISLAEQLLSDKEWLAAEHKGDQFAAAEVLEHQFFHDLCGSLSLFDLLHIYRRYPNESDWQKQGYHLGKLHASLHKNNGGKRDPVRRATAKELNELTTKNEDLTAQLKRSAKQALELADTKNAALTKVEKLERQLARLELENATLKGRVTELERVLERLHPGSTAA